jgi:hypothetical protein
MHAPRTFTASLTITVLLMAPTIAQEKPPGYSEQLDFLKAHTEVVELADGAARVAICPQWQGRVMIAGSSQGPHPWSFGWVNRPFIEAGESSEVFNNYGGADRFWISPEAGQFALFFKPGVKQELANWATPPGLNEGAFRVIATQNRECRLSRRLQLTNYAGVRFDLEVNRTVKLLDDASYADIFGPDAASTLRARGLERVGFLTDNVIVNRGGQMTRDKGLVSIWTLGQFDPGAHTVIIVPYRPGSETKLGPVVTPDYFGPVPPERLKVTDSAVLFLGDGRFRAKLGVSPARSLGVAGSYNFDEDVLTIVSYSLPRDATQRMYMDNRWELPLREPYRGDSFNSYNDGPPEPGAETLGGFYELETVSPALELAPGETLRHVHRTIQLRGDKQALAAAAKAVLGVDLGEVKRTMF